MLAEKGKHHLVCGDERQSLTAAFVSFELLLRRDEICCTAAALSPFLWVGIIVQQILFFSLFFMWKWQTQVSRELVQPFLSSS